MSVAAQSLSREDVLQAVEHFEAAVAEWEAAEEPTAQYQGRTVKAISDALVSAAVLLFDSLATQAVDPEAWELVLAVDRFEAALMHWAQRSQAKPHATDPEGGSDVWGPWQEALRAKTPHRFRQPAPIKALMAQSVTYRQIAKEYGWYMDDGKTPDEGKVLEELAHPGTHYNPATYMHPHDRQYMAKLEVAWQERCEKLGEGSAFGELAGISKARSERQQREWRKPPESIEELLRQSVPLAQIAKMHRVELDEVRRVAAEIGVFSDPSVYAYLATKTPEIAEQREKAEILKVNSRPEYSDLEERIVALSIDGHPPGMIAKILNQNGHPEVTHQRVTRILQAAETVTE